MESLKAQNNTDAASFVTAKSGNKTADIILGTDLVFATAIDVFGERNMMYPDHFRMF